MRYSLFFQEKALKDLKKIDKIQRIRIKEKLLLFIEDPDSFKNRVKKLKGGEYYGFERLRVGSYRVIFYREEDKLVVVVVSIGHRKDIY